MLRTMVSPNRLSTVKRSEEKYITGIHSDYSTRRSNPIQSI